MIPQASLNSLQLPTLNGANPLGFLAALGTLVTLQRGGHPLARLGWHHDVHWRPVLHCLCTSDPREIADGIDGLVESFVDEVVGKQDHRRPHRHLPRNA